MESNDSPEIADRGETSDIPGLPSGAAGTKVTRVKKKVSASFGTVSTTNNERLAKHAS